MPSIWANFDHLFEVFQGLFFTFLLWRKDALGTRLLDHSHKKRVVWKHGLNRNLYVMLKFTERPKTPGISSKKTWLFLKGMKGNKLLAGDFRANLDETNADMVQFTKRWNWK